MNERTFARAFVRVLLWSLTLTPAAIGFSQQNDAARLQADAIARISRYRDYVRRTGDARTTVSELAMAQGELKQSLDRFLQVNDYSGAAWTAINLADILRYTNQWADAIPIYEQADQFAQKARRPDYETKALARMAYSEMRTKQMDAASAHVQKAVRVGANCGNRNYYFEALDTASEVEETRGNLEAASDYLDRALGISSELSDKQQLYLAYGDRGDIYLQKGLTYDCRKQYEVCFQSAEHAKADFRKAQEIAQELGFTFIAQTYSGQIQAADMQENVAKRIQKEEGALKASIFEPKVPKDVLVTEMFSNGSANANNLALVQKMVQELENWQAGMRRQGMATQDLNPTDYSIRGQLAEMQGDEQAALGHYQHAVELVEQDRRKLKDDQARSAFMEDKSLLYYAPARILLSRKNYSEAFSLFEQSRSRTIADMLFSRPLNLGTAQERSLFSQLQTQRTAIASKQQDLFALTADASRDKNGKKIAGLENEIASMQQQYQQLEATIARQAPKLKELTHSEPATLESMQSAAAKGDFDLLYYVVGDTGIILWHVSGSGVQVKNVFLPRVQLIPKVAALRESLESGSDVPFDEEHARQLYLYLIQPAIPYLRTRHLIIIPHEELNSIPFQALMDPGTGKYVGETYAVSYAPSATVLQTLTQTDALQRGRLLAVADPGLGAATEEVHAIGKFYPNRSKLAEAATKADLKSWVGDYNVVHLSMHGEFNEREPLFSYLQLKPSPPDDGRFTAAEMFGLPLKKNSVAVLSACETGRVKAGHSNEVEGIVRALLYAGAGTLVLSAWKVDAAATNLWMQTFYREGQTKPPAEAARLALIAVKSQSRYAHPYFWAPFEVTGK